MSKYINAHTTPTICSQDNELDLLYLMQAFTKVYLSSVSKDVWLVLGNNCDQIIT